MRATGCAPSSRIRPNDPRRPTVCLVHGMNSSSGGFVHMIRAARGGRVTASWSTTIRSTATWTSRAEPFRRDWQEFRREAGETRPWAIVAHSMGALVARSYVEEPTATAGDVSTLILIGAGEPGVEPGQGADAPAVARRPAGGQRGKTGRRPGPPGRRPGRGRRRHHCPGSAFLKALNRRPRRAGSPITSWRATSGSCRRGAAAGRGAGRRLPGAGGAARRAWPGSRPARPAGAARRARPTGPATAASRSQRTRLDGVTDHVTIHANHVELIRAPLLFPDPGPVACMPYLLRWLEAGRSATGRRAWGPGGDSVRLSRRRLGIEPLGPTSARRRSPARPCRPSDAEGAVRR